MKDDNLSGQSLTPQPLTLKQVKDELSRVKALKELEKITSGENEELKQLKAQLEILTIKKHIQELTEEKQPEQLTRLDSIRLEIEEKQALKELKELTGEKERIEIKHSKAIILLFCLLFFTGFIDKIK